VPVLLRHGNHHNLCQLLQHLSFVI
jgi:hypothetical protein